MHRIVLIVIISLAALIVLVPALALAQNYYYGKSFHGCRRCSSNQIHLIDLEPPMPEVIRKLEIAIRQIGTRLDPALNHNNAQGKKLNASEIAIHVPDLISYYMDKIAHVLLGNATHASGGRRLRFAPATEQYRIFARLYESDRDFIDWHYDNNFTKGLRYTLVIPLLVDYCNASEFQYRDRRTGAITTVPIPIGKAALYNGSITYHRITPQSQGCRRLVVIIPLYTDPTKSAWGRLRERLRNLTDRTLTL